MTIPERTVRQRLDALRLANEVRTFRADLKADIAAARVDADVVLVMGARGCGDPRLRTMYVKELLQAMPGMGPQKIRRLFRHHGISPSKTLEGLTPRQRGTLLVELHQHRTRSNLHAQKKAAILG